MKECTGNDRIARHAGQGIACWSGNDDEAHDARHGHDAFGVISVTANIIPSLYSKMMDTSPQDELNKSLQDLIGWLFSQPNPIPINTAMAMCGLCKPVFRLPYVPLSRAEREKGLPLLQDVQEHIPGCASEIRVLEDDEFILAANF